MAFPGAEGDEARFCLRCGAPLTREEVLGRLRPRCPRCSWVYFADPKVAVVGLVVEGGKVLLGRRVNPPQEGRWTLPAGFVDADEDPRLAVIRECREETGLETAVESLVDVLYGREHPRGASIVLAYRLKVLGGTLRAGDDVDEVDFFPLDRLPSLAFNTTLKVLQKAQLWPPEESAFSVR